LYSKRGITLYQGFVHPNGSLSTLTHGYGHLLGMNTDIPGRPNMANIGHLGPGISQQVPIFQTLHPQLIRQFRLDVVPSKSNKTSLAL
jgi:hypothetical protein